MNRTLAIALSVLLAIILVVTVGPTGFLVGLVTAFLPLPFYIALALWLDRNEPEPGPLLLRAFAWGMLVASLVSIVMNAAAVSFLQNKLGLSAMLGQRIVVVLGAPLFEELAKGTALLIIFRSARHEFDNILDGAVYAAMVGLGFAAAENVLYYGIAMSNERLATVFALRGFATPFAHPLFTAMTGIGFGWARSSTDAGTAAKRIAAGLAVAILLHTVWNGAGTAGLFGWAYAIVMVPTFLGVLLLLHVSLHREREIVGRCLASMPDVVSDAQRATLCAPANPFAWIVPSRHRQSRAERAHWRRARRAAVELSFATQHAERDAADAPASHDRVQQLRAAFLAELAQLRNS